MMILPTPEFVRDLLESSRDLKERVMEIARKLEALEEYHPDQALLVAADIVLNTQKVANDRRCSL